MASLRITEYEKMVEVSGGFRVAAGEEPAIAVQTVTFTTSTPSAAFNVRTKFVRIHTDAICSVVFGTNPTAVAGTRLTVGQTEYFGVNVKDFAPGTMKVAAVTDT